MARQASMRGAGVVSACLLVVLVLGAGPVAAQDADDVTMAGTWEWTYEVVEASEPADRGNEPVTEVVEFPADCDPQECEATRKDQESGEKLGVWPLNFSGGVASSSTSELLDCFDDVTGELTTRDGGRSKAEIELRMLDPVQRADSSYAAEIRGTAVFTLSLTAAGRADACTLPNGQTSGSIVTRYRITGTQRALPAVAVDTDVEPVALAAVQTGPGAKTALQTTLFGPKLSSAQQSALDAVQRGTRSAVTAALLTTKDALSDRNNRLVTNSLLALLLVVLMVFPAVLFNSTYEENHDRISAAMSRWRHRGGAAPAERPSIMRRLIWLTIVAAGGALLAGLLDPSFGLRPASIALVVGAFVSIWVTVGLAGVVSRAYRRLRHAPTAGGLQAVPMGLLVGALCVVISRATGFLPGYLYGVLGVMTFAVALDRREEGRATWLAETAMFAVALGSWFAFSALSPRANAPDPDVGVLVADAIFAAIFIGGIEGLLFGLIPMRFLPGSRIASWSWLAWATLAVAVAFTFVNVLLRPPAGYLGASPAAATTVTYALFAVFGLASVLFWAYFRFRRAPAEPDQAAPPVAGGTPYPA